MKPEHLFLVFGGFALFIAIDGWRRGALGEGLIYAALALLLAPFILPFYLARRPLKAGEIREGGFGWNVLRNFAVIWTLVMCVGAVSYCGSVGELAGQAKSEPEKIGTGLGMLLGFGFLGAIWFFPILGALILGLILKKSSVIEHGPSGPLAVKP